MIVSRGLVTRVVGVLAVLFGVACNRDARDESPPAPPGPIPPATSDQEPARIRPMKKVPILVGGCGEDCAQPGPAIAGFLEALAHEPDPERVARFLDTTVLEVDGRALGAQWAQMWQEMRAATRKDSIREAVRDLAAWKDGLSEAQVRSALAEGPRPVRVWTTEAVYDWAIPGGSWRITVRPRGIEWLVTRVDRRSGNAPEPENDRR